MTEQLDSTDLVSNDYLYNDKLLNARTTSHFITIPQTSIDYEQLHQVITGYDQVKYCITKLEQHKDGGLHIHQVIRYKQQVKVKIIHNKILTCAGTIKGCINYQTPKKITACIQYLKKELTEVEGKPYLEWGETPLEPHRPKKVSDETDECKGYRSSKPSDRDKANTNYNHAIELAQAGETEAAIDYIKTHESRDYLLQKNIIDSNTKSINKVIKKYTPPDMTPENVNLNPRQLEVWNLLQGQPIPRRIIWITGHYGSGKTFLYNYIKENHEYRTYDAGQSASLDNVAYGYDEEGVIAWDLPKTFNFQEKGDAIASVIEKFSDFGHTITSKKYSGKSQKVLGHVIVFSNSNPIEQLQHRDIIHINLSLGNKTPNAEHIKKDHQFSDSDSDNSLEESNYWTNLGKNLSESDSDDGNDSDTIQTKWINQGKNIESPRLLQKLLKRDHKKNKKIN